MTTVICPVCKGQNNENAACCVNCGWELHSGIFLGGPTQEKYERSLRDAQSAWAKRDAAPELEKDVFESKDEHRQRLEALGAVVVGTGTLVREGYDIENGYFPLNAEWKDWTRTLAPPTSVLYIAAERDLAKQLWDGGPAYPIMAKLTVHAKRVNLLPSYLQTQKGNLSIEYSMTPRSTRYTKISNAGKNLFHTAKLGNKPNDWGCTLDNQTGLMWEIKTTDGGLRDVNHTYTWYQMKYFGLFGGKQGKENGGKCAGCRCDTSGFVEAVNSVGLCGYKDWRLPTVDELKTLVLQKKMVIIDNCYFPNTKMFKFWSASGWNTRYDDSAWFVNFDGGHDNHASKTNDYYVRLVRCGK